MTTPCELYGCERPADIIYGALVICAHHYKRCTDYIPDDARKAEIKAQVAELQGGERK